MKDWSVFARQFSDLKSAYHGYLEAGFKPNYCRRDDKSPIVYPENGVECNLAIYTGDDFWVLDIDGEKGNKSLSWLDDQLNMDLNTLAVKTGRGVHLYFRTTLLIDIPQTSTGLLPGIDVRGSTGYVIVPPSIHSSGVSYSTINGSEPVFAPYGLGSFALLGEYTDGCSSK